MTCCIAVDAKPETSGRSNPNCHSCKSCQLSAIASVRLNVLKKNWKWEVINWFLWPRRKYVELLGGKISETDVRSFFFVRLSSCKVDSYVFYAFFIAIYWNYNLMELIERQFHRCIQKNRRNEMTSEKKSYDIRTIDGLC